MLLCRKYRNFARSMRYLAVIVLLSLCWASCEETPKAEIRPTYRMEGGKRIVQAYPDLQGASFFISEKSQHCLIDAEVRHLSFVTEAGRHYAELDSIDLKVFRDGVLLYRLSSISAVSPAPFRSILFPGNISIVLTQGEELDVEALELGPMQKGNLEWGFQADGFVQLMNQKAIVEGTGFAAPADLESFFMDSVISVIDLAGLPE
jgi:hypothetical protein